MSAADGGLMSASLLLDRVEAASGKPLSAMLELSDRCNEVCVHCYQVQGQKGELSTGEWARILDELAAAGVLMLSLSGGEATLRKDFLDIVRYARRLGFAVRLFTNGLTMTDALAAALAELDVLEVEISLYSSRADVHDFVTGVPGSFAKTVAGIRHLRAHGVAVTIKTVLMSVNEADMSLYPAFAESLGVHFRVDANGPVPREGNDREPQALSPQGESVQQTIRELLAFEAPAEQDCQRVHGAESVCGAGHNIHLEPNGELRPCTILEVDLGNARTAGVAAAFESPKARAMRSLTWEHVRGCRVCELASRCARCYAAALAETGDALGPHPSACERARDHVQAITDAPIFFRGPAGQSSAIGPYRQVEAGVYEVFEDPMTAADEALAVQLGWTRRAEGATRAPALAVRPGQLVQIRRPGKSAKMERIPDASPASVLGSK